jgi:hypothetical protein
MMRKAELKKFMEILGEENKIIQKINVAKKQMEEKNIPYLALTEIDIYTLLKRKSSNLYLQNIINYNGWVIIYSIGQIKDDTFQSILKELIKARYIRELPTIIGNPLRVPLEFLNFDDILIIETSDLVPVEEKSNKEKTAQSN